MDTIGRVMSVREYVTVTVNALVPVSPARSYAVQVTVVVPTGKDTLLNVIPLLFDCDPSAESWSCVLIDHSWLCTEVYLNYNQDR